MTRWLGGLMLSLTVVGSVAAQGVEAGRAGPRAALDREIEVALALSAGPAEVTADATVLAWTVDGFETAREGTNGVTCSEYDAHQRVAQRCRGRWPGSRIARC